MAPRPHYRAANVFVSRGPSEAALAGFWRESRLPPATTQKFYLNQIAKSLISHLLKAQFPEKILSFFYAVLLLVDWRMHKVTELKTTLVDNRRVDN